MAWCYFILLLQKLQPVLRFCISVCVALSSPQPTLNIIYGPLNRRKKKRCPLHHHTNATIKLLCYIGSSCHSKKKRSAINRERGYDVQSCLEELQSTNKTKKRKTPKPKRHILRIFMTYYSHHSLIQTTYPIRMYRILHDVLVCNLLACFICRLGTSVSCRRSPDMTILVCIATRADLFDLDRSAREKRSG